MKRSSSYCLLFSIFILLAGCEKELGYDLPYEGDRLVVFGLISPDQMVSIRVERTYPPTGDNLYVDGISNATVALYENNTFIENLQHTDKGIYTSPSNFRPQIGKSYSVQAAAEGFPQIQSQPEIIPSDITIDTYEFSDTIISWLNEDWPARKLSFAFTDNAQEANLYSAEITGYYKGQYVAINTYSLDRVEGMEDACGFDDARGRFLLRDFCFNGNSYTVNIGIETRGFLQDQDETDSTSWDYTRDCDEILLRLRKVNNSYLEFYRTGYQEDGFLQIFIEPQNQFSNITGGYGIIAAYNETYINILK